MRFVGRDRELKKLNDLYQDEGFQFVVIYGRRRVGKTMLINEFLKKKRSAYYMAVEGTSKENLSGILKVLSEYNPYEIVKHTHGVSYNDFIWFRFLGEKLTSKDVLVR